MATSKPVVQRHHIKYLSRDGYEWTVNVTKGEHLVLSRLSWYTKRRVSKGLLVALATFVGENILRAEEL